MENLLFTYLLLPIVYFMYQAGQVAREKGYNPTKWRLQIFNATVFAGLLFPTIICLVVNFTTTSSSKSLYLLFAALFVLSSIICGFFMLPVYRKRSPQPADKRTYRAPNFRNAFMFPRIIPRGGFLWRVIAYTILLNSLYLLAAFPFTRFAELPDWIAIPGGVLYLLVIVAIACFGMLYYISYICLPRIRDAGLGRDTLILLFIPGLNLIAGLLLLATPTRLSGRPSI